MAHREATSSFLLEEYTAKFRLKKKESRLSLHQFTLLAEHLLHRVQILPTIVGVALQAKLHHIHVIKHVPIFVYHAHLHPLVILLQLNHQVLDFAAVDVNFVAYFDSVCQSNKFELHVYFYEFHRNGSCG